MRLKQESNITKVSRTTGNVSVLGSLDNEDFEGEVWVVNRSGIWCTEFPGVTSVMYKWGWWRICCCKLPPMSQGYRVICHLAGHGDVPVSWEMSYQEELWKIWIKPDYYITQNHCTIYNGLIEVHLLVYAWIRLETGAVLCPASLHGWMHISTKSCWWGCSPSRLVVVQRTLMVR